MKSPCRLCGSKSLGLYYTEGNEDQFKYYKCSQCGLVNYDMSTGLDQEKHTHCFVDPRDARYRVNKGTRQTYDFIRKHVSPPGVFLDIGCCNGSLLLLAREDGWQVRGIELFESLANSITEETGIEVTVCDFLKYEIQEAESCDVVVLRHVLEHLPDAVGAMNKINSLLKSDGRALLEFPNTTGVDLRLKWFLRRRGIWRKRFPSEYVPHHCNEFSRKSLEFLLSKTGFELEKWQTYSSRRWLSPLYGTLKYGNKARALIRKVT